MQRVQSCRRNLGENPRLSGGGGVPVLRESEDFDHECVRSAITNF